MLVLIRRSKDANSSVAIPLAWLRWRPARASESFAANRRCSASAAFCASVRGMLCKKGNATLLRRSPCLVKVARQTGSTTSQTAGVTTPPPAGRNYKSTQGSATLRLGLCRIPIPYVRVTGATLGRSVRACIKFRRDRNATRGPEILAGPGSAGAARA